MRASWAAMTFGVALLASAAPLRAEGWRGTAGAIYDTYEDRAEGWRASLSRNVKSAAAFLALPFLGTERGKEKREGDSAPSCEDLGTACLAGDGACLTSGLRCLAKEP